MSDPHPARTLLDWSNDILDLANHLGIDTFAVAGESGGGPHAPACAYRCPHRVTMALLLASPSPAGFRGATHGMSIGNRLGLWVNRYFPWLIRTMTHRYAVAFKKDSQRIVNLLASQMAASDQKLLKNPTFRDAIVRDFEEAFRQGGEAQYLDGNLVMTSRGWGFDLADISVPVFLWHGDDDIQVPRSMANHLASQLPQVKCHFVQDAGHLLTERHDVIQQMRAALHGEAS